MGAWPCSSSRRACCFVLLPGYLAISDLCFCVVWVEVGLDWQKGVVSSSRLQRIASIFCNHEELSVDSAMHSIACLPFKDLILLAAEKHKDGDGQNHAWNVPEPLLDYLKTNLNDSQLDAVNVSILCNN